MGLVKKWQVEKSKTMKIENNLVEQKLFSSVLGLFGISFSEFPNVLIATDDVSEIDNAGTWNLGTDVTKTVGTRYIHFSNSGGSTELAALEIPLPSGVSKLCIISRGKNSDWQALRVIDAEGDAYYGVVTSKDSAKDIRLSKVIGGATTVIAQYSQDILNPAWALKCFIYEDGGEKEFRVGDLAALHTTDSDASMGAPTKIWIHLAVPAGGIARLYPPLIVLYV